MRSEKLILEERAKIGAIMGDISKRAEGEDLRPDDLEQFNKADEDYRALTAEWEEVKAFKAKVAERSAELEKTVETRKKVQEEPKKEEKSAQEKLDAAYRNYLTRGFGKISAEERNLIETRGTVTQVVGTDNLGGYAVPESWVDDFIVSMAHYGGIIGVARERRTPTGGQIHMTGYDDTSTLGALITETTADTVSDVTLREVLLDAYTYTSRLMLFSWENMQDTNLVNEVTSIAQARLGRALNNAFTLGTGSSQPQGLVPAITTNGVTAAGVAAITRSEIVDLVHSVDRAYRQSPNFRLSFNDSTLAHFKKLANGSGDDRPLWSPSMREGEPDRIDGLPYVINNDMASLATGNITMICGDFNKFVYRIAKDIEMVRLDEKYADQRSTGFFAYLRADSEILDEKAFATLTQA